MTALPTTPATLRTDVRTGHTYAIPIVRELPIPSTDPLRHRGW